MTRLLARYSMYRLLQSNGIDATKCVFDMVAIRPIFPAQTDMAALTPPRDEVAAQETALAGLLASSRPGSNRVAWVNGSGPPPL